MAYVTISSREFSEAPGSSFGAFILYFAAYIAKNTYVILDNK